MAIFSQPSNTRDRLFAKGKRSSTGFVFALTLSVLGLFLDCHYQSINGIRHTLSLIVSPIQYAVDYPVRIVGWVRFLVGSKTALIDENIKLRHEQMVLEAQLQKFLVIRNENAQLKKLLLASSNGKGKAMAAQILAVDTSQSRQLVVLNKGSRDKVYRGQPVLDAKGVVGQVIDVGFMSSTVLLISDERSAVPVRNNRTGERAILAGQNKINMLSLINLPRTSSVEKGDLLVTSGLGRGYPEGYPVGRVAEIQNSPGEEFVTVFVSPVALLNRDRLVLLVWPQEEEAELTAQIQERFHAIEELVA